MFGKRIELFSVLGFRIRLDPSWFIFGVLITWSLATGLFPDDHPELGSAVHWLMGAVSAIGIFISILLHELAHSLVARHQGTRMHGITLFLFGGVAEMDHEPVSGRNELSMAAVGPIASLVLGALLLGLVWLVPETSSPVYSVVRYLGYTNIALAVFNFIPAFPLDGGRVMRALLWWWRKDLRWATRISTRIGSGFGMLFIGLGLLAMMRGSLVAGFWWGLIGMFLHSAARMSWQQMHLRSVVGNDTVQRVMRVEPLAVPAELSLAELVDGYFLRHRSKLLPVIQGDRLLGCVSAEDLRSIPERQWPFRTVGSIVRACPPDNTIGPEVGILDALNRMRQTGAAMVMVIEQDRLVGTLELNDALAYVSLKMELDQGSGWRPSERPSEGHAGAPR